MTDRLQSPRPRCRTLTGVQVVGTGSYVPDIVVTNEHLHARLGCDSEWIVKRTGILERRHAPPHMATSDLCVEAARRCLHRARATAADVDLVVVGTFTPDFSFPSTACLVQDRLKVRGPAIEIEAACSGFVYALVTAAAYVAAGQSDLALVIGGDCNSRVLNPDDKKTYPLFGDGAGAVLLSRGRADQGLLAYSMGSDGAGGPLLCRPAGGSRTPVAPGIDPEQYTMQMDGRAVYVWAVDILNDTVQDVLDAAGMGVGDVDLYLPHQANIRIINASLDTLRIPRDRVYNNLERYGNTSGGSIPLALDEAMQAGRVRPGNLVVMSGFGAGLTWGTALLRW